MAWQQILEGRGSSSVTCKHELVELVLCVRGAIPSGLHPVISRGCRGKLNCPRSIPLLPEGAKAKLPLGNKKHLLLLLLPLSTSKAGL